MTEALQIFNDAEVCAMKRKATLWFALFAALLAALAIVLRLMRHGSDDLFEIIGPAAIVLVMIVIMSRDRPVRVR